MKSGPFKKAYGAPLRVMATLAVVFAISASQSQLAAESHLDEAREAETQAVEVQVADERKIYCYPDASRDENVLCEITVRVIQTPELQVQVYPVVVSSPRGTVSVYPTHRPLPRESRRWNPVAERELDELCFSGELSPSQRIDCEGRALGNRFRLSLQMMEDRWGPIDRRYWESQYWRR